MFSYKGPHLFPRLPAQVRVEDARKDEHAISSESYDLRFGEKFYLMQSFLTPIHFCPLSV
tara:strand:- start:467 stop:646 length:180 start_codon:yes stop_codon:yes gene_type:complete